MATLSGGLLINLFWGNLFGILLHWGIGLGGMFSWVMSLSPERAKKKTPIFGDDV